ncbi:MAG TPA: ABC transporter permease [Streptosporangiaceae bacterium]|jgi:ABC-2 type transport system permease protein
MSSEPVTKETETPGADPAGPVRRSGESGGPGVAEPAGGRVRDAGRAVRAEWTKLRTVQSTAWLLLAVTGCVLVVGCVAMWSVSTDACASPTACDEDTAKLSLFGVYLGQLAVVVLAALAMTTEYDNGVIRTTLAANPRRGVVLAAKAFVMVAVVLGTSALGVLGSLLASRQILPANGFTTANGYPPLSLADEPTLRAAGGTVLYLGLIALLSLGVGAALRDTAGTLTTVLTLLYVVPAISTFIHNQVWQERIQKLSPMTAGLAVQATRRLDSLPIGPWAGLGVLAAYAGGAMVVGAAALLLRDA